MLNPQTKEGETQQSNRRHLRSQEQKLRPAQISPQQGHAERQLPQRPLPNSSFPLSDAFSSILFFISSPLTPPDSNYKLL